MNTLPSTHKESIMHNSQEQNFCLQPLTEDELPLVSGGRFKIPGTGLDRYHVFYDDGITIVTDKPGCSNA